MSIILAILMFGLLVIVHETGHFVMAKLSKITVYSFSVGLGPALLKKEKNGTVYAIRAIPFGGAVMMKGEAEEEGEDPTGSFNTAPIWNRIGVTVAGSVMNFLLGFIIVFILSMPITQMPTGLIDSLSPGFEYGQYFEEGDEIVRVNEFKVYTYNDLLSGLELGQGKPYDVTILRDGQKIKYDDITLDKKVFEQGKAARFGFQFTIVEPTFLQRAEYAFDSCASFVQSVYVSVKYMVTGQVKGDDVMGTVGITNEISNRAKQSMADMWFFVGFLSINLAVVNLLPIPGLDGGKMVFLLWELVTKRPIKPKYEAWVQTAGLVFLLGLFVFITFNDIAKLIGG